MESSVLLFDEYLAGGVAVPAPPPSKDVPSVEDSPAEDSPSSQDGEVDQFDLTPFDPSAAHAARVAKKATHDAAAAARAAKREEKARAKATADEEAAARKRAEAEQVAAEVGHFAGPSELAAALAELAAADEVSLDLETTALTPWVAPTAPGATQKLGNGLTVRQYTNRFACTLDTTPRARIISLQALPRGSAWAFDLDALSPEEKTALVSGLHGKIWVGHNLAFDLMWLRSIVPDVTPCGVIDTMLLNITHAPEFEFAVRDLMGSPDVPAYLCDGGEFGHWGLPSVLAPSAAAHRTMRTMLAQRDARARAHAAASGEPGRALPLDFLSVALLGEKLAKAFQKPHNWMPSTLTRGHYAYCVGDITQPPQISRILLGVSPSAPVSELRGAIASHPGATAYTTFVRGAIRLTAMQRTGIHMDRAGTAAYVQTHMAAAAEHAEKLLADMPEMAPFKADLLSPDKGLTDELKHAFAQGLTRITGVAPELTDTGLPKLDAKALKMQYRDLPALTHYAALSGALKRASMASAYLSQTDENSRLHPLVSIATVTGRTASQEPNLQNAPRGQDFRALFSAPPGNQIIAVDYSAIEMRIAAALTVRAYREFLALLALAETNRIDYQVQAQAMGLRWFLGDPNTRNKDGSLSAIDAILYLKKWGDDHPDATTAPGERPEMGNSTIDDWRNYYSGLLYEFVRKMRDAGAFQADGNDRLSLADVFARGLDPHIITALATESAAGRFDLRGLTPTDFVAGLAKSDADALKKTLKAPRQAAKAQNFGLLYGMQGEKLHAYGITNYGLDWTIDAAVFAALSWFALYPEVRLWHLLVRARNRKMFTGTLDIAKLFRTTTLTGRPVCSDKLPSALNFGDQGTGAEIALAAIASLPDHLASELVNFVHDELVFECPAELVEDRIIEINKTMIAAADAILKEGFDVPTEVEAAAGAFWIH